MFEKKMALKTLSEAETKKVSGGTFSLPFTQSPLEKEHCNGSSISITITDD